MLMMTTPNYDHTCHDYIPTMTMPSMTNYDHTMPSMANYDHTMPTMTLPTMAICLLHDPRRAWSGSSSQRRSSAKRC